MTSFYWAAGRFASALSIPCAGDKILRGQRRVNASRSQSLDTDKSQLKIHRPEVRIICAVANLVSSFFKGTVKANDIINCFTTEQDGKYKKIHQTNTTSAG